MKECKNVKNLALPGFFYGGSRKSAMKFDCDEVTFGKNVLPKCQNQCFGSIKSKKT
jgi:hypothetical protein